MANCCYHHISYSGKQENIFALRTELQSIVTRCAATNEGQAPDGLTEKDCDRYWFDLAFTDDSDTEEVRKTSTSTTHWCAWGEDLKIVKFLALKHTVEFVCDYEESGSDIYGRFSFKDGIFVKVDIPNEVIDDMVEDEFNGDVTYKDVTGNRYEIMDDIIDKMEMEATEKIKKEFNIKPGN